MVSRTRARASWDLSFSQINVRADALKLDKRFFAKDRQQARADSTTCSRIEQEIVDELARTMTPDQICAFSEAVARGENPDIHNYVGARADSEDIGDGLIKKTITCPETGRKTYEFTNAGARKLWMLPYMGTAHEMLRICKEPQTIAQNARFEAEQRAIVEQLKSGNFVLPEF